MCPSSFSAFLRIPLQCHSAESLLSGTIIWAAFALAVPVFSHQPRKYDGEINYFSKKKIFPCRWVESDTKGKGVIYMVSQWFQWASRNQGPHRLNKLEIGKSIENLKIYLLNNCNGLWKLSYKELSCPVNSQCFSAKCSLFQRQSQSASILFPSFPPPLTHTRNSDFSKFLLKLMEGGKSIGILPNPMFC